MDLGNELRKMVRVLRVATRPRRKEFETMAKVTIVGVIIIGITGMILSAIFNAFDKL
ncbi:MAG: protein translocase SEC61 complex subunit gamma [Candidatus Micrarchaeota archaeon]